MRKYAGCSQLFKDTLPAVYCLKQTLWQGNRRT